MTVSPNRPQAMPGHGIFLLDDHELIRRGFRQVLESAGLAVVGESGSAREAARKIPCLRPDLAIIDDSLPDGTATMVCRAIRAVDPAIRCLLLTDSHDQAALIEAILAGSWGCLSKQDTAEEHLRLIRRALAGGTAFSTRFQAALQENQAITENASGPVPRFHGLTPRETDIVLGISKGLSNRQIGQALFLTEKTVKNVVSTALMKLGLASRTQAAVLIVHAIATPQGAGRRPGLTPEQATALTATLRSCTAETKPARTSETTRNDHEQQLRTDLASPTRSWPRSINRANARISRTPGNIEPHGRPWPAAPAALQAPLQKPAADRHWGRTAAAAPHLRASY